MSSSKSKGKKTKSNCQSRRQFLKKAGKCVLVTASFSMISMTQFYCSSSTGPDNGPNGYDHDYFDYYEGYDWDYFGDYGDWY